MLDPNRFPLDAATVGFRRRMKQQVNMADVEIAIQQQTDAIKVRRELIETPISEVHVMGAQRYGIDGNTKSNEYARQQRQINGYVLRAFRPDNGPIVLPGKYGESALSIPVSNGLPQYVRYNATIGNYVSRYGEITPSVESVEGHPFQKEVFESYTERKNIEQMWKEKRVAERQIKMVSGKQERELEDLQSAEYQNPEKMGTEVGRAQRIPIGMSPEEDQYDPANNPLGFGDVDGLIGGQYGRTKAPLSQGGNTTDRLLNTYRYLIEDKETPVPSKSRKRKTESSARGAVEKEARMVNELDELRAQSSIDQQIVLANSIKISDKRTKLRNLDVPLGASPNLPFYPRTVPTRIRR